MLVSEQSEDFFGPSALGVSSSSSEDVFTPERPTSWSNCIQLLWSLNERKTLLMTNPDGYFYLLYLKKSAQFFSVLFLLSTLILIPTYTWIHSLIPLQITQFPPNFSCLDQLTIAKVIDDKKIIHIVLIVTGLYAIIAYLFLFAFCCEMRNTEFTSAEQYIEKFVAKHAIFIRGVNTKIGTTMV